VGFEEGDCQVMTDGQDMVVSEASLQYADLSPNHSHGQNYELINYRHAANPV
jgi:hypothetical protein